MPTLASLQDLELRILHWINCDGESAFADWLSAFVNDPWFGAPFTIVLFLVTALTVRGRARFSRVVLTAVLALGIVHGVREVVWRTLPRSRPGSMFREDQILRSPAQRYKCAEHPDLWVERGHPPKVPSFPSSHTITAAAVAMALTFAWWPVGVIAWAYAVLVGWGRLYWGKHWPTDVLGSLLLGALAGWIAWRLAERIQVAVARRLANRRSSAVGPPE